MKPAEPDREREVAVDVVGEQRTAGGVCLVPPPQCEQRVGELSRGEREIGPGEPESLQLRERSGSDVVGVGGSTREELRFDEVVPRRPDPMRITSLDRHRQRLLEPLDRVVVAAEVPLERTEDVQGEAELDRAAELAGGVEGSSGGGECLEVLQLERQLVGDAREPGDRRRRRRVAVADLELLGHEP